MVITALAAAALIMVAGCEGLSEQQQRLDKAPEIKETLLTVDFQQGQTLRYKFVSSRDTKLDWNAEASGGKPGDNKVDKSSESVEIVVAYEPVEVNPYGLTTIKATCESIKIIKGPPNDVVKNFSGRSFTLTVNPVGKIRDYSQLKKLILEMGKTTIKEDKRLGRVKDPDMIDDFIATQWFLWDSVSCIENIREGVSVGQTWNSTLSVPTSMVLREGRDVTYRLDEIKQSEKGELAVIHSSYSLSKSKSFSWPVPYSGRFQIRGQSGFLRMMLKGFKSIDLKGQGEEVFNIDEGRMERYKQQYEIQLRGRRPAPLPGLNPRITIKQTLTMQFLE